MIIPKESIICVENSSDKLIIRAKSNSISKRSVNYIKNHNMFEFVNEKNPIGNKEVIIKVIDVEKPNIDKKYKFMN